MPGQPLWGAGPGSVRRVFDDRHWNEPLGWNKKAGNAGVRTRVFCASMADVFDNRDSLDEERERLWTLIHKTPNLDWQLLTKRISNVTRMVPPSWMSGHWPKHAWLGISVVNQEEADRDIPKLLAVPAAVRFLSCEPLLSAIDLNGLWGYPGSADGDQLDNWPIHWLISGGESGPKARPSHPDWFRSLRDQCEAAGVAYFFKQWGQWGPDDVRTLTAKGRDRVLDGAPCAWWTGSAWREESSGYAVPLEEARNSGEWVYRLGKKAAGRLLDGRTHDEFPTGVR